jgi:virginiamycin B lyase
MPSSSPKEKHLLATVRVALAFLAAALLAACGKGTPVTNSTPTPAPTPTPAVTSQYPIPTASSEPMGIALGSDGLLWITEFASSKVAQLYSGGKISEDVTPKRKAGPLGIASGPGPNLNVWFTEANIHSVAQITTSGPPYTEYTLPDAAAQPTGIALGGDGNMWVTDPGTNSIWKVEQRRVKPHVKFTRYKLTGNAQPFAITNGPDSALYFTEPGTNSIGRLPLSGSPLTEYQVTSGNVGLRGIVTGDDGGLWFIEQKAKQIERMSTTGIFTAYYPLTGSVAPDYLVQGIDGNFYFTDTGGNKIGQFFFHSHRVNLYKIPTANSQPTDMTLGTDSQVYFIETAGNKIGQFRYFNV